MVRGHTAQDHACHTQILTAYEGTMEGGVEATEAYEHSEMMLYKVQVLLEGGSCTEALDLLDAVKVGTLPHVTRVQGLWPLRIVTFRYGSHGHLWSHDAPSALSQDYMN